MSKKITPDKINKADFVCRDNCRRSRLSKKLYYYIEINGTSLDQKNGSIRFFSRARKARSLAHNYKKKYPKVSVKLIKVVSKGEWDFFIPYDVSQ